MNPGYRLSARQALAHMWFSNGNAPSPRYLTAPNLCSLTRACSKQPFLKNQNVLEMVESFARPQKAYLATYQCDIDTATTSENRYTVQQRETIIKNDAK